MLQCSVLPYFAAVCSLSHSRLQQRQEVDTCGFGTEFHFGCNSTAHEKGALQATDVGSRPESHTHKSQNTSTMSCCRLGFIFRPAVAPNGTVMFLVK